MIDTDPDRLVFATNSWSQQRFFESDAPELLLSGHLGSGKTRPLCEKVDFRARRHPRARIGVCRRFRTDLGGSTLKTFLDCAVSPEEKARYWRVAQDGGSTMNYPNGSQVIFFGLDRPGKALSTEYDLVVVDEAQEVDEVAWDTLAGRLRWKPGPDEDGVRAYTQIAGCCNPGSPTHFLFRRFRPDQGSHVIRSELPVKLRSGAMVAPGSVVGECILSGENDNQENLDDRYLYRLQRYRGRFRDRYVLGLWVMFEGSTYGEVWSPSDHVVAKPKEWDKWGGYPPLSWRRYRSFDFGFVNPFVCQWWARDHDNVFWRYREIYYSHRTVPEHKAQVVALEQAEVAALQASVDRQTMEGVAGLVRPERLYCSMSVADHDAGDRAILERGPYAIITRPAKKDDVDTGVQTVYEMLAQRRIRFVRDARVELDPALDAHELPTCTEDEMPMLHYPVDMDTALTKRKREGPVKENDHGHDALWYLMYTIRTAVKVEVVR